MVTWLRRVILPVAFPGESFPEIRELKETDEMLAERAKKWPEQWLAQGREEGRLEGRLEGRVEGRLEGRAEGRHDGLKEAVRLQLQIKFGLIDASYLERLDSADEAQLIEWAQRVLDAEALSAIFED